MREEDQIQKAIVDWIKVAAPEVLVFAVPNASVRTGTGRASNAVPGLLSGVWDLALVLPPKLDDDLPFVDSCPAFIEVKTAKGRLTPDQVAFGDKLDRLGVPRAVCRSIDDVRAVFRKWKVSTRESV